MTGGLFLDASDPWVDWSWLSSHVPIVLADLQQHVVLTVIAVVGGLVIALPLGVAAHRWTPMRLSSLGAFGVFYTIPSLALFALLVPYTGITEVTAEIALIGYNVLILLRNVIVGLDEVPADVLDAADGMGYRPRARLLQVELPLALPAIIAGVRVATVSTIGIVTIAWVIGVGGLGELILQGYIESFHTPLVVGSVLCVALALLADVSLATARRKAVPWARTA
ncbi:MAG: ABC transporter permease [Chloroflexi bacterium]|nr:MAG: ABC transporter permease [Chloroflexota bacterium]